LGDRSNTVRETVDARKNRFERDDLPGILEGAKTLIASRGKSSVTFDLAADDLDLDKVAAKILGPAGTLRAPTLKVGKTVLVGFGEVAWATFFGG
jgi:arsenate reductase-like glutaredoxin family protein